MFNFVMIQWRRDIVMTNVVHVRIRRSVPSLADNIHVIKLVTCNAPHNIDAASIDRNAPRAHHGHLLVRIPIHLFIYNK